MESANQSEPKNDDISMAVSATCPHCSKPIIIRINQPLPAIDIMSPEELDKVLNQYHDNATEDSPD